MTILGAGHSRSDDKLAGASRSPVGSHTLCGGETHMCTYVCHALSVS